MKVNKLSFNRVLQGNNLIEAQAESASQWLLWIMQISIQESLRQDPPHD